MSRPRMLTFGAMAAACWLAAADGLADGVINPDDMFWLAAAVTVTLAAVLLQGFTVLSGHQENEARALVRALGNITRRPGGDAPTGPFPALQQVRQRESA